MVGMTILGLDVGEARIGLAVGDSTILIASPWGILEAQPEGQVFAKLQDLIRQERIERIVIGMPYLLREPGHETDQQRQIRAWAERFEKMVTVPCVFADETLSTALAARWQNERQQKGKRDDLAAVAILQAYLDRLPSGA